MSGFISGFEKRAGASKAELKEVLKKHEERETPEQEAMESKREQELERKAGLHEDHEKKAFWTGFEKAAYELESRGKSALMGSFMGLGLGALGPNDPLPLALIGAGLGYFMPHAKPRTIRPEDHEKKAFWTGFEKAAYELESRGKSALMGSLMGTGLGSLGSDDPLPLALIGAGLGYAMPHAKPRTIRPEDVYIEPRGRSALKGGLSLGAAGATLGLVEVLGRAMMAGTRSSKTEYMLRYGLPLAALGAGLGYAFPAKQLRRAGLEKKTEKSKE